MGLYIRGAGAGACPGRVQARLGASDSPNRREEGVVWWRPRPGHSPGHAPGRRADRFGSGTEPDLDPRSQIPGRKAGLDGAGRSNRSLSTLLVRVQQKDPRVSDLQPSPPRAPLRLPRSRPVPQAAELTQAAEQDGLAALLRLRALLGARSQQGFEPGSGRRPLR